MEKYTDVMLDLETLGTNSYSVILTIAAVEFNIATGKTGKEFYSNIDLNDSLKNNFQIDASTFYWWLKQSDDARKQIYESDKRSIENTLKSFTAFISPGQKIWGNGARFDLGILRDYFISSGYHRTPWDFRLERDVRTIVDLKPSILEKFKYEGTAHNALHDCHNQIKYVSKIWRKVKS